MAKGVYDRKTLTENWGKECEYIDFQEEDLFMPAKKFTKGVEGPPDQKIRNQEYILKLYKDPVKFTSDNFDFFSLAFAMKKNSIFFKNFRDCIQRLFESGIFQMIPGLSDYTRHFKDDWFQITYKPYERKGVNVVLSWNYLYAGFVVWAVVVAVSVLVFVGELLVSKIKY